MFTSSLFFVLILTACEEEFTEDNVHDLLANTVENLPTTTCTTLAADFSEHAMWMGKYKDGKNAHFFFDDENGSIEFFEDSSAHITGTVLLPDKPGDKWKIDVWIYDPKNWDEWSSFPGRTFKGDSVRVGDLYKNWIYYTFDSSKRNQLIGDVLNGGDTLTLRQSPYDLKYGLQVGYGANDKNNNFGLSVWFTYYWNGKLYDGDFNFDLDCPGISRFIETNVQVTTLAGGGFGNTNGTGLKAKFGQLRGLCVDAEGNIYVADQSNYSIRKITPAGVVTTLAGSTRGYVDGVGINAKFAGPRDVAVDIDGNVYVADAGNHRIRKITPDGVVTTFAGSTQGFADGTGVNARFRTPQGVAVDADGNVYIADYQNFKIRKITPAGVVTTLAGSTREYADGTGANAKFVAPQGLTVDANGNVYVADGDNQGFGIFDVPGLDLRASHRIRKITQSGVVTTLAGSSYGHADGAGINAMFRYPQDVAVDAAGNVYVADGANHRIRKISSSGEVITLAGSAFGFADGSGANARFAFPSGLAVDPDGNIYIADAFLIRKLTEVK